MLLLGVQIKIFTGDVRILFLFFVMFLSLFVQYSEDKKKSVIEKGVGSGCPKAQSHHA